MPLRSSSNSRQVDNHSRLLTRPNVNTSFITQILTGLRPSRKDCTSRSSSSQRLVLQRRRIVTRYWLAMTRVMSLRVRRQLIRQGHRSSRADSPSSRPRPRLVAKGRHNNVGEAMLLMQLTMTIETLIEHTSTSREDGKLIIIATRRHAWVAQAANAWTRAATMPVTTKVKATLVRSRELHAGEPYQMQTETTMEAL